MKSTDYFRGSFKKMWVDRQDSDNKSIIIEPLFSGELVDFSNPQNLWALAYNARKNANDLYDLVMEKYDRNKLSETKGFEMLTALINLSSELYIKCIIYYYQLNQAKQCKGFHNLEEYFSMLPDEIKSEIETIDDDFETNLKNISDYFNKFRYSFEFNVISSNIFSFAFAEKLNQICNAIPIQGPPEVVYSNNKLLLKQGVDVVWDSSNQQKYTKSK